MKKEPRQKSTLHKMLNFLIIGFIVLVIVSAVCVPSIPPGSRGNTVIKSVEMMDFRSIGLLLTQYAADHNGHYPEGKTSTEVFQHLLDEKYLSDSEIFYFRYVKMPGKSEPLTNQLKPENVSWDVTCCVDSSAPDKLPLVFLTGYKITYQAGARAEPIIPVPPSPPPRTWMQWGYSFFIDPPRKSFTAVCYKDTSARAMNADEDGSIPNFIPADFDPKGKTYQQLTP